MVEIAIQPPWCREGVAYSYVKNGQVLLVQRYKKVRKITGYMRELFLEIKGLVLKTPGFPTSPTAWVSATIYTIYHNYTNYSVHSNHSTIHFPDFRGTVPTWRTWSSKAAESKPYGVRGLILVRGLVRGCNILNDSLKCFKEKVTDNWCVTDN